MPSSFPLGTRPGTDLLQELGGIRFTGWIAPPEQDWLVVLGDPGDGVVADEQRGIIEVGALLAEQLRGPVLAVRVRHDRQLALVAWRAAEEVGKVLQRPVARARCRQGGAL